MKAKTILTTLLTIVSLALTSNATEFSKVQTDGNMSRGLSEDGNLNPYPQVGSKNISDEFTDNYIKTYGIYEFKLTDLVDSKGNILDFSKLTVDNIESAFISFCDFTNNSFYDLDIYAVTENKSGSSLTGNIGNDIDINYINAILDNTDKLTTIGKDDMKTDAYINVDITSILVDIINNNKDVDYISILLSSPEAFNEESYMDFGPNYFTSMASSITIKATVVPEPSTYAIIFGALALGFVAYCRRK